MPSLRDFQERVLEEKAAQTNSNEILYLTDLVIRWKKDLTPEASAFKMSFAPAAAFPPIVVPLIRMPE
jgi:hypothetical protein